MALLRIGVLDTSAVPGVLVFHIDSSEGYVGGVQYNVGEFAAVNVFPS